MKKFFIFTILLLALCISGCNNKSNYNVTELSVEETEVYIEVGDSYSIAIEYDGIGDYSDLNFNDDNEGIIERENEFITGKKIGIVNIEITAKNDPTLKAYVTIYVSAEGYKKSFVRLTAPTNVIKENQSIEINVANLSSLKANNNSDFIWSVSDPSILSINKNVITGLKQGICTVFARQINSPGSVGEYTVYVGLQSTDTTPKGEPENTPLVAYFDDMDYVIDASKDEQINILGAVNYQRYKYCPSDEDILLISDTGLFMGVKEGEVKVTIYSKDASSNLTKVILNIKVTGERKRDYLPLVLQIALAEEGYREWTGNNDTKYGEWNNCNYEPWCATFVSWVMNNAGVPKSVCMRSIAVRIYENTYRNLGQFGLKGEYQPQPGNLIIFSSAGAGHIGIVVRSDETTVYTIEGNTSNMVAQRSYPLDHETITGYVILNWDE